MPVAHCQINYWQQLVNYKIDVTLNDVDNTLDGFIKIDYTNNSPDTLQYIWFNLWPNAYKNDKTAFSDQLLENGRTDFYFSDDEKRGYINRLDFRVNGITARLEDHPQYIDVAKLVLPLFLAPGQTIHITTPFHEKIPYNFSRGGHVGQSYQITQWYPKPAVYDSKGWHPIPYLDQGEFYSEFGSFDVQITLPKNYVVAATGELQNQEEKNWLIERSKIKSLSAGNDIIPKKETIKKPSGNKWRFSKKVTHKTIVPPGTDELQTTPASKEIVTRNNQQQTNEIKTLHYLQDNIHDFAWFADKRFLIQHDTLQLQSGRVIDAWSFYTPAGKTVWTNSLAYIKDAVRTRSMGLGEYPFNVVTALEAQMGFNGGMEYPTITSISPMSTPEALNGVIEHEVGHNWNYGILATNERTHPWMDEGMNTYFDNRYNENKYPPGNDQPNKKPDFIKKRLPQDAVDLFYRSVAAEKKDQPIETSSEYFSELNYGIIAYHKTGLWMKALENYIGEPLFDSSLHAYYNRWKFKHPYPEDFKKVAEDVSGKNLDSIFSLLNKKGNLEPVQKRDIKFMPFFSFRETDKHNYIFISPSVGYNYYDGFMIGGLIHNYTLPANRFQFFAAPMYANNSKKLAGLARIGYHWTSYGLLQKTELSVSGAIFSTNKFIDSTGQATILGFKKIVPSLKIIFRNKNARSPYTKFLQWKTYLIQEDGISFFRDTVQQQDIISYPKINRYLNQLRLVAQNNRTLYPYSAELVGEQGSGFIRASFTGNYFFNYSKGGGANVRLFAGKFFYLGDKTFTRQFETDRYHLTMTGPSGYEDYTYSNYFIGRNEFDNVASQQIMLRDGGFKVRTDLLAAKVGKTDDWLSALNFKTDLPSKINPLQVLPVKIPVKIFFDIGTYAEAWKKNATTGKFIYDAGFQVSILKDLVNIYIPVAYSKIYSDYFKSTLGSKRFWKTISFSIDIQDFNLRKFFKQIPL